MMLPVALVSVLAGSPAAPDAPPATLAPAPAPAPAELSPTPAPSDVVAVEPAPAPAPAPSPPPTIVIQEWPSEPAPLPGTPPTTVIEEWPSEPAPAPVVVTTPAPLTLSPPAPTWGPVQPAPYVPPAAARVQETMRQHRRGALGAFVVGGLGMGATLGFQAMRVRGLQRCAARGTTIGECGDYEAMDFAFSRYGALGMAMFVAGTAGAGAMLGNAAATRDVQLHGRDVRSRTGLKVVGVTVVGIAVGWMAAANMQLKRHELECDGDPGCLLRYRPLRLAANDGAALGVAAGAGLVGYAIGYERQGRALMRLRAAPSLGARGSGVAVTVEF